MLTTRMMVLIMLSGLLIPPLPLKGEEIVAPGVAAELDVVYVRPGLFPVKLDIAWPEGGGPYPVVVYFHGGGWFSGDKAIVRNRMMLLAQSGYVVFNANYRLLPRAGFPEQVDDAMGAVIWAKEHAAEHNGDPSRVALMGDSAGGYLSMLIALTWDDPYFTPSYKGDGVTTAQVQAVIPMYCPYRLVWVYEQNPTLWRIVPTRPMVWSFLGGSPKSQPERYAKASPANYVGTAKIPPVMIVCGDRDLMYPESVWLHLTLESMGVEHTALFISGADHEFNFREDMNDFPQFRFILEFLEENLSEDKR
jgi:acetyl esterase/lipase